MEEDDGTRRGGGIKHMYHNQYTWSHLQFEDIQYHPLNSVNIPRAFMFHV